MKRLHSIRHFLTLSILGALLVAGISATALSYRDTSHEVNELFDAELAQLARLLSGLLAPDTHPQQWQNIQQILLQSPHLKGPLADGEQPDAFGHPYESKLALQVFSEQGVRLLSSNTELNNLEFPLQSGYQTLDSAQWRAFILHDISHQRWIWVAQNLAIRHEITEEIALHSMLPWLGCIGLVFVLISLLIRHGFAPLETFTAAIQRQSADKLSPIELPQVPREVEALLNAFNQMVQRINASFERERQFSANAAHELRTPLAALSIHLQNARKISQPDEKQHSIQQALNSISRMTHMVEQLLTLSRLHQQPTSAVDTPVALAPLTRSVVAELYPALEQKQQQLQLADSTDIAVNGNEILIRLMLRNLLENAIRYTPPQGCIKIELQQQADKEIWQLCDNGPGIDPSQYEAVLQPFYRNPNQAHVSGGSGIGLAIVNAIAQQHNIQLQLSGHTAKQGLCVRLHWSRSA